MDRTLTQGAVAHHLGDALGVRDKVKALSAARDAGQLSQQDVTAGIARLLNGLAVAEFDRIVAAKVAFNPGAEQAVQGLRDAGVAVALCSDSFSRAAAPVAEQLGIPRFAANVLEEREGRLTGELLPWARALRLGEASKALDKREAVPLLARAAGVPLERTCVVGDGVQDGLAMGLVGLGIAFDGVPAARAAATHHLEGSLAPVPMLVLDWLAGLG